MQAARCMRADRCVCIYSIVMHPARYDRSLCIQLGAMHLHHWRGHALNRCAVMYMHRCAVMHLNRCAVMRVSLWERFGIVRQTRRVDILSGLVVGVCRDQESL